MPIVTPTGCRRDDELFGANLFAMKIEMTSELFGLGEHEPAQIDLLSFDIVTEQVFLIANIEFAVSDGMAGCAQAFLPVLSDGVKLPFST